MVVFLVVLLVSCFGSGGSVSVLILLDGEFEIVISQVLIGKELGIWMYFDGVWVFFI